MGWVSRGWGSPLAKSQVTRSKETGSNVLSENFSDSMIPVSPRGTILLSQRKGMPAIWTSRKSRTNSERSSLIKRFFNIFRYIPIFLIDIYQQFISPLWHPSCRFYPTCSTYARQALKKYGIIRGGFLALVRLSKCHPFHPGGYDPLV